MWTEVKNVFRKYAVFDGRSNRREYWFFYLFNIIISSAVSLFSYISYICINVSASYGSIAGSIISSILVCICAVYDLAALVPGLAVTCRRLHDTNRSGAYIFISLIPIVGPILLLIWLCEQGTYGDNAFGPSPDGGNAVENKYSGNYYRSDLNDAVTMSAATPALTPAISPNRNQIPTEPLLKMKLICNTGALSGKIFTSGDALYIGRSKNNCNVVFPEDTRGISRTHCCLKIQRGQLLLTDLGSSYGTFLQNGTKLQPNAPVIIGDGTRFYLAGRDTSFTVYMEIG